MDFLEVVRCTKRHATRPCGADSEQFAALAAPVAEATSEALYRDQTAIASSLLDAVKQGGGHLCQHDVGMIDAILSMRMSMLNMYTAVGKFRAACAGTATGAGGPHTEALVRELFNHLGAWVDDAAERGAANRVATGVAMADNSTEAVLAALSAELAFLDTLKAHDKVMLDLYAKA